MYSEEVKLVFGFDPSGLFEKVIFAPGIGIPRTSPPEVGDDASELRTPGSGVFEVTGASVLTILGNLIFGNCPVAGWVNNDATNKAAISINDDLIINTLLVNTAFQLQKSLILFGDYYSIEIGEQERKMVFSKSCDHNKMAFFPRKIKARSDS